MLQKIILKKIVEKIGLDNHTSDRKDNLKS